jgi:opacity protein-like surface antigen
MRKTSITVLFLLALFVLSTETVRAQNTMAVGAHFGIDLDQDATFIGAQARFGGASLPIRIQPGLDYGLNEDDPYWRIEVNGLYLIGEDYTTSFTPYVGPGIALTFAEDENDDTETNFGINIVAGIEFRPIFQILSPYVQARYTLQSGADPLGVMGGLLVRF